MSRILGETSLDEVDAVLTDATFSQLVEIWLIVKDSIIKFSLLYTREWVLSLGKDVERQHTHCPSVDLQIVFYMTRVADHLRRHEVSCSQCQLHCLIVVLIEYL